MLYLRLKPEAIHKERLNPNLKRWSTWRLKPETIHPPPEVKPEQHIAPMCETVAFVNQLSYF